MPHDDVIDLLVGNFLSPGFHHHPKKGSHQSTTRVVSRAFDREESDDGKDRPLLYALQ